MCAKMSMRGSAKLQPNKRFEVLKLSSLQGDVQEEGHFEETSKKKAKEKSGVTLVVIHLGIGQLPTCCDHTKPMLSHTSC